MKKVIYIEGTADQDNGNLRNAFSKLLEKELSGQMPAIIMGDGKNQTVDKFHSTPIKENEKRFLLVDSDCYKNNFDKKSIIEKFNDGKPNRKVDCTLDNSFFMVYEAEAWILSQEDVLKKQGLKNLNGKDSNNQKPCEILAKLYKQNGKEYHKVRDFQKLFVNLDTTKLKNDFPEFNNLIEKLKQ